MDVRTFFQDILELMTICVPILVLSLPPSRLQ